MTRLDQLIVQGKQALADDEFAKAVELLGEVYGDERSFENNWLFSKALYQNGQAETALTIAREFVGEYMWTTEGYEFYFDLCLVASSFVAARRLALGSIDFEKQENRLERLKEAEEKARKENGELIKKRARELKHLAAFDAFTQQQIYQDAQLLPFEEYFDAAKQVLIDPDCLPLIRMTILIDMQSLMVDEELTYRYIDGKNYTTKINHAGNPLTHPAYEAARDYLQEVIGQEDPVSSELLHEQLKLEFNALFPQIDRVTDPIAWMQKDIQRFQSIPDNEERKESSDQAKLHELVYHFLSILEV
ncbi:hypothetical protein ACT5YR_01765 [Fructobacillus fructosus]|uniref:hypothetical protein n=1 Tax=Fructobacillus fructosus TaxID=1631 RepID=UPI00403469E5